MSKHREWWIDPIEMDAFPLHNFKFLGTREWQSTCVHVIEYSALEAAQAEIHKLKVSLNLEALRYRETELAKAKTLIKGLEAQKNAQQARSAYLSEQLTAANARIKELEAELTIPFMQAHKDHFKSLLADRAKLSRAKAALENIAEGSGYSKDEEPGEVRIARAAIKEMEGE